MLAMGMNIKNATMLAAQIPIVTMSSMLDPLARAAHCRSTMTVETAGHLRAAGWRVLPGDENDSGERRKTSAPQRRELHLSVIEPACKLQRRLDARSLPAAAAGAQRELVLDIPA